MVKMGLKSKSRVPYGGLYTGIVDPTTGASHQGLIFENVLEKAVASRKAMGVPVGQGFEDEVEQWICQRYPDECENVDPDMPRKKSLTFDDVVRGTKVLVSFMVGGRQLVNETEAERRASICVGCPLNQSYSRPCSVCQELRNGIVAIVGNRQTSAGDKLRVCGICGCSLEAAVWMRLEDQCKGVTDDMRREFDYMRTFVGCWKTC